MELYRSTTEALQELYRSPTEALQEFYRSFARARQEPYSKIQQHLMNYNLKQIHYRDFMKAPVIKFELELVRMKFLASLVSLCWSSWWSSWCLPPSSSPGTLQELCRSPIGSLQELLPRPCSI